MKVVPLALAVAITVLASSNGWCQWDLSKLPEIGQQMSAEGDGSATCGCFPPSSLTFASSASLYSVPLPISTAECGPFDTSLTTVLGANQDIPDLYYAGSVSMVVITVGSVGNLQYNDLGPAGFPLTVDIEIGGEVVAQIQPGGDYNGRPFSFTYGGNTYCGNFIEGTVNFVPEPATFCTALVGMAGGGVLMRWRRRKA